MKNHESEKTDGVAAVAPELLKEIARLREENARAFAQLGELHAKTSDELKAFRIENAAMKRYSEGAQEAHSSCHQMQLEYKKKLVKAARTLESKDEEIFALRSRVAELEQLCLRTSDERAALFLELESAKLSPAWRMAYEVNELRKDAPVLKTLDGIAKILFRKVKK